MKLTRQILMYLVPAMAVMFWSCGTADSDSSQSDPGFWHGSTGGSADVDDIDDRDDRDDRDGEPADDAADTPARPLNAAQKRAVAKCLSKWDDHPFAADVVPRALYTSVNVGGRTIEVYDRRQSRGAELVFIPTVVNVFGSTELHLLNPKAWYCLDTMVNVRGSTTVYLKKGARLADSVVVDVGNPNRRENVNVEVDGNVRVQIIR